MLGWCRARVVPLTTVAFALAVTLVGSGFTNHAFEGHALRVVLHDASAHQFTSSSPAAPAPELDCVLCHLTRGARPSPGGVTLTPSTNGSSEAAGWTVGGVASIDPSALPPLRAPPQAPL